MGHPRCSRWSNEASTYSPPPYQRRPDRLARGFTAPNIPRASDTVGPAMIHLWRGYRTARYSLLSFLILSLPHPPPFRPRSSFCILPSSSSQFFLPLFFFSFFLPLYPPLFRLSSFLFLFLFLPALPFATRLFCSVFSLALNLSILAFPFSLSLPILFSTFHSFSSTHFRQGFRSFLCLVSKFPIVFHRPGEGETRSWKFPFDSRRRGSTDVRELSAPRNIFPIVSRRATTRRQSPQSLVILASEGYVVFAAAFCYTDAEWIAPKC